MDYFFIGESELLTAFRFVGVGGKAAANKEEAVLAFRTVTKGSQNAASAGCGPGAQLSTPYKILILTERVADWIGEELTEWQLSGNYPLLVEIPGIDGKIEGRKSLVDSIREAIGIHV
ncbi:MAG: ATPase V [Spirochaetaceae bacterium]|nr:ATPase V [Spirochaetaceae bacterium]